MKKSAKILLLLLFVVVFACGLSIWAEYSPVVDDYRWIYNRETEDDLVSAFATALRINHPAAYDMIDPALKPRLDDWMNTHQSLKCKNIPYFFMNGFGTSQGSKSMLSCFGYDGRTRFEVDDIVIRDMKVIDWGEVIEGD
ncbi:MAG: hypothetical protein MHPDNHAH_00769 [Anaerolineales bacterium]|nr:hypothetical protein [Anaerolineales bacterium]